MLDLSLRLLLVYDDEGKVICFGGGGLLLGSGFDFLLEGHYLILIVLEEH